jgi:transcription-repair coupling factor (superfamily II helicase)
MDRIWRYGSEVVAVSLDKLDSEAWLKRRAKVEAEIAETAKRLAALSDARAKAKAAPFPINASDYDRFVARFRFAESPDQEATIEETLQDLAAGQPMDRLVCGDVGFGKTEVALRAAAAVAMAGGRVAVVAPTTVLVRQHVETFRKRFAGFGIEIAQLSRLTKPAEQREVKKGIADGRIRIVIGTHALANKDVRFDNLGLLIIDEEQRFGTREKARLRLLGDAAHVLTLTATPIPRTLQAAMIGIQDLSLIATPPVRRRPIRTVLTSFDPAVIRTALLRERARGGQSFIVCPRIEDMEPMAARLRDLVPELHVTAAHGKMPADEIDDVMMRFAQGRDDVLLATNIIESGLDLPNANTILIWRADRFGMAQLHQLRGRVGRGRRRGAAYLLTEPGVKLPPVTEKRLRTLEAQDRLGAGFEIAARDLDLRGAGDLIGEEQAGHIKLIGTDLYRRLLSRALEIARGGEPELDWTPDINLGAMPVIPQDYVPEPEVRLNLYAQLARLTNLEEADAFAEEVEDRFGEPPEAFGELLARAQARILSRELGIAKVQGGPKAIVLTPREGRRPHQGVAPEGAEWREDRLVFRRATASARERYPLALTLLRRMKAR